MTSTSLLRHYHLGQSCTLIISTPMILLSQYKTNFDVQDDRVVGDVILLQLRALCLTFYYVRGIRSDYWLKPALTLSIMHWCNFIDYSSFVLNTDKLWSFNVKTQLLNNDIGIDRYYYYSSSLKAGRGVPRVNLKLFVFFLVFYK